MRGALIIIIMDPCHVRIRGNETFYKIAMSGLKKKNNMDISMLYVLSEVVSAFKRSLVTRQNDCSLSSKILHCISG